MSIANDLELLKGQVGVMSAYFEAEKKRAVSKKNKRKSRLPGKITRKVKKKAKDGHALVALFGANRQFTFDLGLIDGGLVWVGEDSYAYDPKAVYMHPKKKIPVIGLLGWRLNPVGSLVDELKFKSVGGEIDAKNAEALNITKAGQKTIIRQIEAKEVAPDDAKKKKKPKIILWIIFGVVGLYLASRFLNGGA